VRSEAGYEFVDGLTDASGERIVRAIVRADGAVSSAAFTRSEVDASRRIQHQPDARARRAALAIPERLMLGRSFAVGDQYYRADYFATLLQAFDFPIPVHGESNVPLRGESVENGARVLIWEGSWRVEGNGDLNGAQIAARADFHTRVAHDARTGLVREHRLSGVITVTRNGVRWREILYSDEYFCEITPQ
jgi:hypothetical protein